MVVSFKGMGVSFIESMNLPFKSMGLPLKVVVSPLECEHVFQNVDLLFKTCVPFLTNIQYFEVLVFLLKLTFKMCCVLKYESSLTMHVSNCKLRGLSFKAFVYLLSYGLSFPSMDLAVSV